MKEALGGVFLLFPAASLSHQGLVLRLELDGALGSVNDALSVSSGTRTKVPKPTTKRPTGPKYGIAKYRRYVVGCGLGFASKDSTIRR